MLAVLITGAVVSRGYEDAPAIRYSESSRVVFFRIGKKVYDSQAENNHRWVNLSIKGFGDMPERVKKMQLKEGSYVNIRGRLDEMVWTDKSGNAHKNIVVVAEDIEYAGGNSKEGPLNSKADNPVPAPMTAEQEDPSGEFTGYETFGGTSFFGD